MFTDKQLLRLTTIEWIAPTLYVWVRKHTIDVPYNDLTPLQRKTLHLIADMPRKEQEQYVIIDDILVKTPTNTKNYTIVNGQWVKRLLVR
jgi:DNA-binding MarR family transcriptional regulator